MSGEQDWTARLRGQVSTGGGRGQTVGVLLEAAVEAGVPAALVVVTLVFSTQLSDMLVAKRAAVHLLVPALALVWLARQAADARLRFEEMPYYWPLGLYLLWNLGLLFFGGATNPAQGLETLAWQAWLFLFFILVAHYFRDPAAAAGVMWVTVLTGAVVALLGILQAAGWQPLPLPARYAGLPISTLGNPNFVAHYQEIVIPLAAAMWGLRRRLAERVGLGLVIALAGTHLLLSQSRAGWLGVAAGLAAWAVLRWRHGRLLRRVPMVLLVVLLASPAAGSLARGIHIGPGQNLYGQVAAWGEIVWRRVGSGFDLDNFSVAQRLIIWGDTLALIADRPLTGVGVGHYETALPAYRDEGRHRAWHALMGQRRNVANHAHNEYLEYWAEGGILALAAMAVFFFMLLRLGWRGASNPNRSVSTVSLGCMAGIVATLVHALFSFNLQDPVSAMHFWLLAGLLVTVNRGEAVRAAVEWRLGASWRRLLPLAGGALMLVGGAYLTWSILASDLSYFAAMEQHRRQGHVNRAVLTLRDAVDARGWEYRYHHTLGMVSLEAGHDAEARSALARSLSLHPNNAAALRLYGRALATGGAMEEAIRAAERAVALAPYNDSGHLLLGRLHVVVGRYETAGLHLSRALELEPGNAEAQGYAGAVLLAQEQWGRAAAALRQAVGGDAAGRTRWRYMLAEALRRDGRRLEALEQARLAAKEAPQDAQIAELLRRLESPAAENE